MRDVLLWCVLGLGAIAGCDDGTGRVVFADGGDAMVFDTGAGSRDAEPVDAAPDEDAAVAQDASTMGEDAGVAMIDAGVVAMMDAGVVGPDASVAMDAGVMGVDAGTVMDAGVVAMDAGVVVPDAGVVLTMDARVAVDDAGAVTVGYAADVQPIFQRYCSTCHTGGGSGGHNIGTSYADTQLASYYCPDLTKGACAIVRIRNGTMPPGGGAGLTAEELATLDAWVMGGQQP